MTRNLAQISRIVLIALIVSGCSSLLEQPALEKRSFLIAAEREHREAPPRRGPVLATRPFSISPSYEGQGLVARRGGTTIESDFYNQLFVPPAAMLENAAGTWLRDSGLFVAVGPASTDLPPSHSLEGTISALYGDFTVPDHPSAVVDLQMLLLDSKLGAVAPIIARGEYRRTVPISAATPAALVAGWSTAVSSIFADFEGQVRTGLGRR